MGVVLAKLRLIKIAARMKRMAVGIVKYKESIKFYEIIG